jgi:3-dehydroquinate dehydratase-2
MKNKKLKKILVINGPNLDLLGRREPEIYGKTTLADIKKSLKERTTKHKLGLDFIQSNSESTLVERIASAHADFIIINPAAFTHTSVAIRDALLAAKIPFIEVHLSNIYAREAFRKQSYLSDIALGVITGLGKESYQLALDFAIQYLHAHS